MNDLATCNSALKGSHPFKAFFILSKSRITNYGGVTMSEIPLSPVKRLLKKSSAERVSKDATEELRDELEEYARERATESAKLTEHAGRKTIQATDVEMSR